MTTLTEAEEALFTKFNAIAFDIVRKKASEEGKIPPCWLCFGDDARKEARQDAVWLMRGATGRFTLSEKEAENMAEQAIPASLLASWRAA